MTNRPSLQEYLPRTERQLNILHETDGGKAAEAPLFTDNLWRQIDRWVNEGGAVGDKSESFAPDGTGKDHRS
jgi:hypothetical protein